MEVYIEYVVIDNLVINTLILLCVKSTLRLKSKWYQILLSACLGTVVACVLPLLNLANIYQILIKILLGLIMVLILARYLKFKEYLFSFLLFIGYTVLLGGACLATLMLFGTSLEALSAGGYDSSLPLGIIFLIVSMYVYIVIIATRYLSRKRNLIPFLREVMLVMGEKTFKFHAFIDSGNKLIDSKTGLPVVIVSLKGLEKYFTKQQIENLILQNGKESGFKGVHTTAFSTLSGDAKKMIVFEADKLVIISKDKEYTTNRFIVGVTYRKFNDAVNYDMLLSPLVL